MHQPRPAATSARDWLVHPVTCVALVVLVVNDHVLKEALGTWWTGKLSDVAWLVVVPPLVATVLAGAARLLGLVVGARACATTSVAVTAAAFVLVKSLDAAAVLASSVLSAVAGPSRVMADPTDLLALPALLVAWYAARPDGAVEPSTRRRELRWLVLLPLVVLATAATTPVPPPEGAAKVVVDDGRLGVRGDSGDWYVPDGTSAWRTLDRGSAEATAWEAVDVPTSGGAVCTPSGTECFRAADEGIGVDRSIDGGDTWQEDWAVPSEVVRELTERYDPDASELRTRSLAILPTGQGFHVYAANGGDGLAVRDRDGTWTRIGQPYDDPYVEPLPMIPPSDLHPLPVAVTLVVPATLVLLLLTIRRRDEGSSGPVVAAWWLAAPAAVLAALAIRTNLAWGPLGGRWVQAVGTPGPVVQLAALTGLVLTSAVLATIATGLLHRRAAWLVAAAAVGSAVILELVSPLPLAALGAAALLAAGTVSVRRTGRPDDTD